MKRPNLEQLIRDGARHAVKLNEIGMKVVLILDDNSHFETTLTHLPWQLGHGAWVAGVAGKSGGWDVLRIIPKP